MTGDRPKTTSYKKYLMISVKKNTLNLLIIFFLSLGSSVAYPQQKQIPVQHLTDIYNNMKAGRLELLEDKEIHIRSEKTGDVLKADVYAIIHNRFIDIYKALSTPDNWCEFVLLHLNVKTCTCTQGAKPTVTFYAGRKFYEPPEKAYELKYQFQITEYESDRFRVQLTAEEGPYGTSDYTIVVEAILMERETLLHMYLSYETGFMSRLATRAYLSTIGKDKVGFSIVSQKANNPVYIQGVNGIIERNVMRYFLALSVYLDTLNLDSAEQFSQRAEAWYELTEQYAIQLHELEKQEYMEAKRREYLNQYYMQNKISLELSETATVNN